MLSKIKHLLQTTWIDRYTPEPHYISVPEPALVRLEQEAIGILSDPTFRFLVGDDEARRLVDALVHVTGKPRGWYLSYIEEESFRRRRAFDTYNPKMEAKCG